MIRIKTALTIVALLAICITQSGCALALTGYLVADYLNRPLCDAQHTTQCRAP
jgi:hypothetical protein